MRVEDISIRTKLVGLLVGLCATVLFVACGCFVYYDQTSTSAAKEQTLTVLADSIAGSTFGAASFQDAESTLYVLETLEAEPTALYAGVYVSDFETGEPIQLSAWSRPDGPTAPKDTASVSSHLGHHDNVLYLLRPIQKEQAGEVVEAGQLLLAFSTEDLQARFAQQLQIAGLILLVSILGALVAASRVHRIISAPIDALAGAAGKVREDGDYSVRVDLERGDELGVLAQSFNAMLADIQSRDQELNAHREHLEELVAERTRDLDRRNAAMRLVLDNVDQGLATLSPEGQISSERSARFDDWFGPPAGETSLDRHLAAIDSDFGDWLALCWESLTDGFLPTELALDQLPSEGQLGDRHFAFRYKAIEEDGALSSVLLISSDTTAEVARQREEERQRQLIAALQALSQDRQGFIEFLDDAESLLGALDEPQPTELLKRRLHTLKGNSALIGLAAIAREVHALEDALAERALSSTEIDGLRGSWRLLAEQIETMMGPRSTDGVKVSPSELAELVELAEQRIPHAMLAERLRQLSDEPMSDRLGRFARQAEGLSRRLGRPSLNVIVEDNDVRLPVEPLAGVWGALGHLIRNAIDHGIEPPEERAEKGRPEAGTLTLRTRVVRGSDVDESPYRLGAHIAPDAVVCLLEITDDGRGVDWEKIGTIAAKKGLPSETPAQRAAALFADGLSTRSSVSETSGRGVGTAAVAGAVEEMGGTITVQTSSEGTRFSLWLPLAAADRRFSAVA